MQRWKLGHFFQCEFELAQTRIFDENDLTIRTIAVARKNLQMQLSAHCIIFGLL